MARNYSDALQFAKESVTIDSEFWVGHMQLGQAYEQLGETQRALDALSHAARLSGGNSKPISLRAYILARTNHVEGAHEVLHMLETVARERYLPPYAMALIYVGLSQPDQAFESLDRAFDMRDVHLAFLPVDPKWDELRSDPRFAALLHRCNFDKS
jgi:Flp pilus assembly protein TadD